MLISSEGLSDRYLHLNNCGRQTLSLCDTHTVRPNGRVDYHILYILAGVCHAVVDGKAYDVIPGQIVLFQPKSPQEYSFFKKDKSESIWIHFTGVGCGEYLRELGLCDKAVFEVGTNTELISAVEAMLRTKALGGEENDNSCDGYLYLVLSLMARAAKHGDEKPKRFSEISNVVDFMSRNYRNTQSISEYAAKCHLSKSRFEHIFKEYTGTTPLGYIFKLRIKAAMNLLENTKLSISQISEEVGFADANYFTRVFKKHTGISPIKYRNNMSGDV